MMSFADVNSLTSAWLRHAGPSSHVVSGAGLWPLLAVLASSADEPGRTELVSVLGVPADRCMGAAQEMLKTLADADGVDAALAIWVHEAAQVNPDWVAQLPPANVGELTGRSAVDQPKLDTWARENTRGLIERLPVETRPDTMMILATALAARTTWVRRFSDARVTPRTGPWARQRLAGLTRTSPELEDLRVATAPWGGAVTLTRVEGDNSLDVYLVLGDEDRSSADVLVAGMSAIAGDTESMSGAAILDQGGAPDAPGVALVAAPRPSLSVVTVAFTVRSDHDLLTDADLFGLGTVSREQRGHFSRIGPVPLRIDQARQSAAAVFSATGFEAAAVTSAGLRMVSMPVHHETGLQVRYDRPFGFLAVHRQTGLVLFAGWVQTPARAVSEPNGRRGFGGYE